MFDGWRSNNNSILGHIEIPFQGFPSGLVDTNKNNIKYKYKILTNYQPNTMFWFFVYATCSLLS